MILMSGLPGSKTKPAIAPVPPVAPLAEILEFTHHRRLDSIAEFGTKDSLYSKVGREDVLAFPDLLPEASCE